MVCKTGFYESSNTRPGMSDSLQRLTKTDVVARCAIALPRSFAMSAVTLGGCAVASVLRLKVKGTNVILTAEGSNYREFVCRRSM